MRSLCAVLLRKTVMASATTAGGGSLIKSLSAEVAETLKKELLLCIEAEPQRNIRKKVCDAVGQLGINLLNENLNGWPELLPFMLQYISIHYEHVKRYSDVQDCVLKRYFAFQVRAPPRQAKPASARVSSSTRFETAASVSLRLSPRRASP